MLLFQKKIPGYSKEMDIEMDLFLKYFLVTLQKFHLECLEDNVEQDVISKC